ncbi:hypothetical protein UVI_02045630 [Ustilaginoidea virens]|uniref:Uncharacterized protein n=1 Tax=Ustilaginoidea virens TaxID=1159556 RepID=A0A1B5L6Y2_USTVR|nr:hypothetical protein UVI_02045630 [Ustilaginoidea virens]
MNPHRDPTANVPPAQPPPKGDLTPAGQADSRAPVFHAETHPPGTAPKDSTFLPQPVGEFPVRDFDASHDVPVGGENFFPGATSADVHRGLGHPGQGMTSRELHGGRERDVGMSMEDSIGSRKLDVGRGRGKASADYPTAEERVPDSA